MSSSFQRIALVGFGLMGGSLAKALKASPNPPHLLGVSDIPEDLDSGVEAGLLDSISNPASVSFEGCDLVVYASPPKVTLELLTAHAPHFGAQTIISDMVSLKKPFLTRASELDLGDRYVGCHPMVGGTGSGFAFARIGLFRGARVWITPGVAQEEAIERVEEFWDSLGASPARIDANRHDEMMAWVSHLPQITSNALALALDQAAYTPQDLGSGGQDMTRLAGSSAAMWRDLLEVGPEALLRGIGAVEERLAEIRSLLEEKSLDEIAALMDKTARWLEEEG